MKRFSFKLEAVLRLREQEEQLVQIELADALRLRVAAQAQLDASRQAQLDIYEYVRTNQVPASELQQISRYDELHRQRIVDATIQLAHLDADIERVRLRLNEAMAAKKALEKLKERQSEQHRKEMLAAEAAELDEMALMRHGQSLLQPEHSGVAA